MLEAQREEQKDDIPFGIRAIESGIEVDGVWISRSNTPVGSSRSSMTEIKLPRSFSNSQLELPQAIHGSSRNSSRAPSSFDIAVSAERIPSNESRSTSPASHLNHNEARGRPSAPRSSTYSNSNITRNSTTLHALEGAPSASSSGEVDLDHGGNSALTDVTARREPISDQQASSSSSANTSGNTSGKSSRRTSDESDYMALQEARPYEAAYINPRHASLVVPVDPRTDLDLLQSHRLSHVAETGQLTPRVRRPGNSGEWASVAENLLRSPQEIATANGVDYFVPQQKTPSPPLPPAVSPSDEAPAPFVSRPTQDGHARNQAKQAVPLLETYAPRPYYLPEAYQPQGPHHQHSYDEMPIEVKTGQNRRDVDSQVLRKVNSGFEILRPGTFAPPSPEEEDKAANAEKRQSKRLQKKRRSSAGSRTSHFVEQV